MPEPPRRGIQSVEIAAKVLRVLSASPSAMPLSAIAREAGMPASKVHRYLGSLINTGLVTQDAGTGHYDLGPFAQEMGVSALARYDPVNNAADSLRALAVDTGATAMLSVWGPHGPTVVRWERAAEFLVTALGLGSVLPLTTSATGNVFLAFLPDRLTATILAAEGANGSSRVDTATIVARTRSEGYARTDGSFIPGLAGIAAPILNWQDEADAVITLFTPVAAAGRLGDALPRLIETCRALSRGSERSAAFP